MVAVNGTGEAEMEKVNTHIITLTRFLTEEQVKHKEATGDFTYVYATLALLSEVVSLTRADYFTACSATRSSSRSSP